MNIKTIFIILSAILLYSYAPTSLAANTYVQGAFCNQKNNKPISGLKVSLAHPKLGRSALAYTNRSGFFSLINIPKHNIAYYLEVYWSNKLLYRSRILVKGPVKLAKKCI